jgi:hypothetical protein
MATGESGRALLIFAALVVAVSGTGCAQRFGKQSAKGMVAGLEGQSDPNKQLMRVGAHRAVEGAVAALEAPEQREQIRGLVSEVMSEAVQTAIKSAIATFEAPEQREQIRSLVSEVMSEAVQTAVDDATRQMVAALGPDGDGRLTASLANASSRIAAGVVSGARGEMMAMFPDCSDPDPRACMQRQLHEMARSTAAGFTKGMRESLALAALFVAFAMGVAGGVFGTWLMTRRPQRRVLRTA